MAIFGFPASLTSPIFIPLARRYPLSELRHALEAVNRIQSQPVMVEYLMLAGMNDSPLDARELIDYVAGLNVHINLIPYNPIEDAPHLSGTTILESDAASCKGFSLTCFKPPSSAMSVMTKRLGRNVRMTLLIKAL